MIVFFFALQGCFAGGGINALNATYLAERFPTEVRATAGAFCSQQGAIFGALTAPILTFFAVNLYLGFAIPMLIGTIAGCASFIVALLFSPETRRKQLVPDVVLAYAVVITTERTPAANCQENLADRRIPLQFP